MNSFYTLIQNNDSAGFLEWDRAAQQYSSQEALSQAVAEAVALSSRAEVATAFENLGLLLEDLFDKAHASSSFQSDPEFKDKLGVSLMRGLFVLSAINWAAPDLNLAVRFPMRADIPEFIKPFYQRMAKQQGADKNWTDDLKAGRDPLNRYTDRSLFTVSKTGHFSPSERFRDAWEIFEDEIPYLDLEIDEGVVEQMVSLISSEPSPAAEWINEWLGLVSSYPEPDDIEELSPRMLQMRSIARIRVDLQQSIEESEYDDVEHTCRELAFQFNGWSNQFLKEPQLAQDTRIRAIFGAMTSLVLAFAYTNSECQQIIIENTNLRAAGYL